MTRVAIVGGGPGGLFTAWHLVSKAGSACDLTVFEADDRIGGKIWTREFAGAGGYEAGLAEIYDYSGIGPDPLRQMIERDLKLRTRPIAGGGCVLEGRFVRTSDDLAAKFGIATRDAVLEFHRRCAAMMSPREFYAASMARDNGHPWAGVSAETVLATCVGDESAKRYLRTMMHSDIAASLHQTDGLNALKNVVMDVPGYMAIYSVVGGNEAIIDRLTSQLDGDLKLNMPVRAIRPMEDGTYRLLFDGSANFGEEAFDIVVLALPLNALSLLEWRSPDLHRSMKRHIAHFDRPGHYLRVTLLFDAPFWREHLPGAWWMLDAFDGCCVYDESARQDGIRAGILGLLIAGNAALELSNRSDDKIQAVCLEALPSVIRREIGRLLDIRVHRWMASVNAIPGGRPVHDLARNHRPAGTAFPDLYVVGDYLFDSTLNGTLDSADAATDMIVANLLRRRGGHSKAQAAMEPKPIFLDAPFVTALARSILGPAARPRILHLGADSDKIVAALRAADIEAWGVHVEHPMDAAGAPANETFLARFEAGKLPFSADRFDFVYESCFHRMSPEERLELLGELRRVCRGALLVGSPTTDLPLELIERYGLLSPAHTLASRWELSEMLLEEGFDLALADPASLAAAWDVTLGFQNAVTWFEEPEGLLYAVYAMHRPTLVDPLRASDPEPGLRPIASRAPDDAATA
ncbi:MAG: FAD-dependent oxidoreductase [Methylobacterium mesophilicum]|nr:FAD-dependent oxidoreductase [Methylobacterium mesophilicum]